MGFSCPNVVVFTFKNIVQKFLNLPRFLGGGRFDINGRFRIGCNRCVILYGHRAVGDLTTALSNSDNCLRGSKQSGLGITWSVVPLAQHSEDALTAQVHAAHARTLHFHVRGCVTAVSAGDAHAPTLRERMKGAEAARRSGAFRQK